MNTLLQDARYGVRTLAKNPVFSVAAIITLALGIGVNTVIFSAVNSVLLRPLQVRDADQITAIFSQQQGGEVLPQFSVPELRDIQKQTTDVFSGVVGYQYALDGLSVNGRAHRVMTSYVTGDFFSVLGIRPALGRLILPSEGQTPGADPVMVLSHSFWKTHFGGDPGIVGKSVILNGHPVTIVGVAPEGFFGFSLFDSVQGYLPISMFGINMKVDAINNRAIRLLMLRGRLQPDKTLQQADASLAVVAHRLSQEYPVESRDLRLLALPELRARFGTPRTTDTMIGTARLFLALAALVLLLACVNVGNLLLVRATVREREMAIRSALGGGRARLVRLLLTESVILAVAGGVAGILLGMLGSALLGGVDLRSDMPYNFDFGFDWRVFGYGFAAALLSGLAVGIIPAVRASRGNLNSILREGGRGLVGGRHRLRGALVAVQVGASLMLLVVAGLFTRSLGEALRMDFGFNPVQVVNATMDPKQLGYGEEQGRQFFQSLLERVRALPGVVSASTAMAVPMGYYQPKDNPIVDGYETAPGQPALSAGFNVVSTDYFGTMGIELRSGRTFTDHDQKTTRPVAVVNRTMAERYWPGQDPIGRTFRRGADPKTPIEIVGVVDDVRFSAIEPVESYYYLPFAQRYASYATLQVRTAGTPAATIRDIRGVVTSLAPDLPVFDVMPMSEGLYTANGLLIFQVGAGMAAVLGLLGLVLSVVGLYGVISYATAQRTHEIGIRMALGAQPWDILRMVLGQGVLVVGIGLVLGLAAAFAAARLVGRFLIVSPTDTGTYLVVSAVLALVALVACYIPARRGLRVDPLESLR